MKRCSLCKKLIWPWQIDAKFPNEVTHKKCFVTKLVGIVNVNECEHLFQFANTAGGVWICQKCGKMKKSSDKQKDPK